MDPIWLLRGADILLKTAGGFEEKARQIPYQFLYQSMCFDMTLWGHPRSQPPC